MLAVSSTTTRRVAGAGGDEAHGGDLAGLSHNGFTTGHHEQLDARMREELLRHFDGGFLYGDKQVGQRRWLR